ncbi:hypothetical protein UA08_05668 [Talaromyces atroroseus]|uniref:PROP1-like PPR domain-containing protein n=1 Tax=Talaromyces atroroseus TaxID=1441469 RepID=A0A225ANY9_TALAT|nr:hypothetical protein UA08_05668 [Talaromyces atroroseus]OKL59008.1 hypothetical protein UA08_05668 [Talaromyces atroroseus]
MSSSRCRIFTDLRSQHLLQGQLLREHSRCTPKALSTAVVKLDAIEQSIALLRYKKKHAESLPSGLRSFPFASHVSHIHAKSLSTYAVRKDSDDQHHEISDEDTRSDSTDHRELATDLTETEQFALRFIPGKGRSEWSTSLRRRLNVPPNQTAPTRAFKTKARLYRGLDKRILESRTQDFAHAGDLNLFLGALNDKSKSNQYVFSLYKRLPSPGVRILTRNERIKLLHRFAHPPDRRRSNARNFLSIFDDMIQSGFTLSRSMYTSAIYFISHKVPVLEGRDLQDAITVWHRMEKTHGQISDNVVFELLFRIASNTGNFTVADRILSEMTSRGMELSRNGHMSLIYSYGKRGDVDAIHRMFQSYVHSGQIVDTVVLNCLISSLLNTGELETVEQLYSYMMHEHRKTIGITPKERRNAVFGPSLSPEFAVWKLNAKGLRSVFDNYLQSRRKLLDEKTPSLQNVVPITPDTRTFHILFRYHCLFTGDITAISRLLMDMEQVFDVPPRPIVYYFLFRGFALHQETKGWTAERLREVWRAFRRTLYESYTRVGRLENGEALSPRWENPLQSICKVAVEPSHDNAGEQEEKNHRTGDGETQGQISAESQSHRDNIEGDTIPEEENLMKLFDEVEQLGQFHRHWYPDEKLSRRIENGVFLSRELNIVILKAFGAHFGTNTLLRVFLEIERMWKPWKRLGHDVQGVKKELQKQLVKAQNRERHSL